MIYFLLVTLITTSQIVSQDSLAVTIYNNDFAIVKDVRTISFDQGQSMLYFTDVSINIQSQTVTFKALKNPNSIKIYEQNFEKNLIDQYSILQKYIEKKIDVYAKFGDSVKRLSGILLSQNSGFILKTNTGVITLNNIEAVQLPSIPDGFFTVPTLNWKVLSQNIQTTQCQVAYRTTGFSWSSDYSITLSNDEKKGDIGGWVTIDNNSGKKYVNAKLKLLAGDVNVVKPPQAMYQAMPMMMMAMQMSAPVPSPPSFSQKSFADYHLYTLSAPVTINQSSKKQIQFIPKVYGVKVRKYNQISISAGGQTQNNLKASNKVQFNNSLDQGLGIPFPKGTIRIFKEDDSDNSLQFIGEDSIKHTPKNENITLSIGTAFDITADLISDQYQTYPDNGYKAKLSFTLTNHKDIQTEIQLRFNTYQGDNLKIVWDPANVASFVRDSVSLSIAIFRMNPNQKILLKWTEDYHP